MPTEQTALAPPGSRAFRASPLVANGRIYVGTDSYQNNTLFVLDQINGAVLDQQDLPGGVYGSPLRVGENMLLAINVLPWSPDATTVLRYYDIENSMLGSPLWERTVDGQTLATPLVAAGKIFHTVHNETLYVLEPNDGTDVVTPISYGATGLTWGSPAADQQKIYIPHGTTLDAFYLGDIVLGQASNPTWSFVPPDGGFISGSPAVANGFLYFGTDDTGSPEGVFYALDTATGSVVWSYEANQGVGSAQSSPAVASDRVVFVSYDDDDRMDHGLFVFRSAQIAP